MQTDSLRDLIGIPFVDGGRDPNVGLDCWGLCRVVFRRCGVMVPDFPAACYDAIGIHMQIMDQSVTGHWAALAVPDHVCLAVMAIDADAPHVCQHLGVYIGNGQIIHTLRKRHAHLIRVNDRFFARKIRGFYRWIG